MSLLARFKILTKILAVVLLLSSVTASLSWVAIHAMASMNDSADNMMFAASRALNAARANQNVIALNRAEFRVALDPSAENRGEVHKVIDEQMKAFESKMDEVNKTRDDNAKSMLPAVHEAMAEYKRDMETTLRQAEEVKDNQLGADVVKLRDAAMKSRGAAEKLRALIKGVADRLDERVKNFEEASTESYQSTSRVLIIFSITGTLIGLLAGFMIGQYGVAKPIVQLKATMEVLASNDFTAAVPGTERRDEVGDMARTVEVFKERS